MKTLLLLLCLGTAASGQSARKTGVRFTCKCDDMVGARFATTLRDLIAASPRYMEVSSFQEGKGESLQYHWGIRTVSVDPSVGNVGADSALATVITIGDIYFTHSVENCVADKVQQCAEDVLALLDAQASN